MRNLLFFMAEWGNLYVIGAIVTTLFLGGWHIPFTFENPIVQHGLEFATVLPEGIRRGRARTRSGSAGRCRVSASTR
jgi:hypothetical protein